MFLLYSGVILRVEFDNFANIGLLAEHNFNSGIAVTGSGSADSKIGSRLLRGQRLLFFAIDRVTNGLVHFAFAVKAAMKLIWSADNVGEHPFDLRSRLQDKVGLRVKRYKVFHGLAFPGDDNAKPIAPGVDTVQRQRVDFQPVRGVVGNGNISRVGVVDDEFVNGTLPTVRTPENPVSAVAVPVYHGDTVTVLCVRRRRERAGKRAFHAHIRRDIGHIVFEADGIILGVRVVGRLVRVVVDIIVLGRKIGIRERLRFHVLRLHLQRLSPNQPVVLALHLHFGCTVIFERSDSCLADIASERCL